jgi:hypothetical protein
MLIETILTSDQEIIKQMSFRIKRYYFVERSARVTIGDS